MTAAEELLGIFIAAIGIAGLGATLGVLCELYDRVTRR